LPKFHDRLVEVARPIASEHPFCFRVHGGAKRTLVNPSLDRSQA
jgi:hypothetical protein